MKSIIKVEGVTEYFCNIVFVTELYINGVQRKEFPRRIYWLLEQIRSQGAYNRYTKARKKFRKNISLLMMNIGNLYNCVDEVYGLIRRGYLLLPDEFIVDFNRLLDYLPKKFIIKEKYYPEIVVYDINDLYFSIIRIRPQAISYLKQKERFEWSERIIKLLELMGKQHNDNIDFDKYIDEWSKKLLDEVKYYGQRNMGKIS